MSDSNPPLVPVEGTLDACIKCNICTAACPVSAVTDLFPGPKYCGPQAARFRGLGIEFKGDSVDYCSGCRVCNLVCPSGVKIAEMNARARASAVQAGHFPWRQRIRNNLLARPGLLGRLGRPLAHFLNPIARVKAARHFGNWVLGVHPDAPLPRFATRRFSSWFKKWDHRGKPGPSDKQVAFFHGCSTEFYEPRVGRAAVRLLASQGFSVSVPPQNCCGLPLLSNGEFQAARRYHGANVQNLLPFAKEGIPIVGTSTSCTLTLKEEAPELLDMHDDGTRAVAEGVYDWNEFLLLMMERRLVALQPRPLPLTVVYHMPCQYRAHRLGKPGLEILRLIPDLRVIESGTDCCGIAGTYGYKSEKYEVAMKVGQPLFDRIRETGAPIVLCDSETCRWQIEHATRTPAFHPVEILCLALGLEDDTDEPDARRLSSALGL